MLRGSGVDHDLRRDGEERYTEMYDGYAFEVIVQKNGHYPKDHQYPPVPSSGGAGRLLAPVLRADAGSDAVDRPGAPGDRSLQPAKGSWGEPVKLTEKLPKGEAYLETECPRGQMGFYIVSDGSSIPWRVRARSSSFCNLVGHARTVPRLPDCRRAGDRRLARHRDGRDRPVRRKF